MPKRQRRVHENQRAEETERRTRRRRVLLVTGLIVIALLLIAGIVLVLRSAWVAQHNGQLIGVLGLAALAVLFSLPIVVEFNRHPRPLSGPGRNPEQGWRP